MKNLLIFLNVCFIYQTTLAQNQNDEAAIEVVIENFKKGIIEKDSVLLNSLFFAKNTPVIGVMSVPTEKLIQQKNPNFQGLTVSDSKRFIEEICTSTTEQQEIFANTIIQSRNESSPFLSYMLFPMTTRYINGAGKIGPWYLQKINGLLRVLLLPLNTRLLKNFLKF